MSDIRSDRKSLAGLFAVLAVATVIDVAAGLLVSRTDFGWTARVAFALLPVPANLVLVALIVRTIRALDEFLRRVHLEAIAIAFLVTGLAVFIYGYLQTADAVPPLNVGVVWFFMVVFYGVGYFVASRHYR